MQKSLWTYWDGMICETHHGYELIELWKTHDGLVFETVNVYRDYHDAWSAWNGR